MSVTELAFAAARRAMRKHVAAGMRCAAVALALGAGLAPSTAAAQASPSPFTTATRYDALRRVTGTISPDPDGAGTLGYLATRSTYDAAGRLTRVEHGSLSAWQSEAVAPASWTGFSQYRRIDTQYDAMGRKTRETLTSGTTTLNVTQFSYDGLGRLQCTAVRMNPAAFGALPAACTLGPPGTPGTPGDHGPDRITRNHYDLAGQLLRVEEAVGTAIVANEAVYSWTANGRRASLTDGNGNRSGFAYDGHDRQSHWHFPTPATPGTTSTTDFEQYGYDSNGNRTSLRNRSNQNIAFSYDALNRLTLKNLPGTEPNVTYSYDLRGLQLSASSTAGSVTSAWDDAGRLTSSTTDMGGVARTVAYQHDSDGNRIRITHPDGMWFDYDYDGLNRLTGVRENGATTGPGVLATYAYDVRGQRASLTRGNGTVTTYTFDGGSRLSTLTQAYPGTTHDLTLGFTYNPANQIATSSRSNDLYAFTGHVAQNVADGHDGLNRITITGGTGLGYDSRGNITLIGTAGYGYNSENMLVSGGGIALVYDPLMRLHQASTTRWAYDGVTMITEYNSSNALVRRFVHGPGIDEPLVWYEGSGTTDRRFLHADERGSIIAVSDGAGAVIGINRYDEYGMPVNPVAGRFHYTGRLWIISLGLYYYRARFYNPTLGRFMQTDPIGYDDQVNLYAYVGNDPVNTGDPAGTERIFGWVVERLRDSMGLRRVRPLRDPRELQRARQRGEDVISVRRQRAIAAERAGNPNPTGVRRHRGHENDAGDVGRPHGQTEGRLGHSFWQLVAGFLSALEVLDQATDPFNEAGLSACQTIGRCDEEGNELSEEDLRRRHEELARAREEGNPEE